MQSRPNPHDAFFRQAFGSPRHIAGLLKLVLPKRLRALLDLDPARIRLHDAAHIDPALRGTASDLIVEVPRRGGVAEDGTERAPAIFIFAVEHQRRDERFVVLRQLGYTVRIWERWLRDHPNATHLPPVVPVVIHNDDQPWRAPTNLSELIDLPDVPLDAAVRSYLPSLEWVVAAERAASHRATQRVGPLGRTVDDCQATRLHEKNRDLPKVPPQAESGFLRQGDRPARLLMGAIG
jgi:predicted transposase YdaD